MARNPLDTFLSERSASAPDPRSWCHEQNIKPIFERMDRWYYVANDDGRETVTALDGEDGGNVRRMLADELPDFEGWPKTRMDGYRKWLRGVAERGLRPNSLAG